MMTTPLPTENHGTASGEHLEDESGPKAVAIPNSLPSGLPGSLVAMCGTAGLEAIVFYNWAHKKIRGKPEELDKALHVLENTPEQAERADLAPWLHYWKGWLLHDRSDFSGAIASHQQALHYFESQQDTLNQAKTAHAIAASLKFQGYLDRSLEWAERGLKAAASINEHSLIAAILANIGEAMLQLRRYAEAETYLKQALGYHPSESARLVILIRQCELAVVRKDAHLATELARKARHLAEHLNLASLSAQALAVQAATLALVHEVKEAKGHYARAVRMAEKLGDRMRAAIFLLDFGLLCQQQQDEGSAHAFFNKALGIAVEMQLPYLEGRVRQALYGLYRQQQRWQDACDEQEAYIAVQQKLFLDKSDSALKNLVTSQALQEAETYKKLYDRVSAIAEVGRQMSSGLSPEELVEQLYQTIKRIMPADVFGLAMRRPGTDRFEYKLMIELDQRLDAGTVDLNDRNSIGAWCCRTRKDVLIRELDREWSYYVEKLDLVGDRSRVAQSLLFCPLMYGDEVTGLISVQCYKPLMYSQHDLEGLRAISLYVAIALETTHLQDKLRRSASNDPLTGVLNRQAIIRAGLAEYDRHQRYASPFSLILLSVTNLKIINTTLGNTAGDTALQYTVRLLAKRLRSVDSVGRYGGEEFLVVLPETGHHGALGIAGIIHEALSSTLCPIRRDCQVLLEAVLSVLSFEDSKLLFDEALQRLSGGLEKLRQASQTDIVDMTPG